MFGIDTAQLIHYRFHLGARSDAFSTFTIREHSTQLGSPVGLASTQVGSEFYRQLVDAIVSRSVRPTFSDEQSQLHFAYATTNPGGNGFIDWYEIFYSRKLEAHDDLFSFN